MRLSKEEFKYYNDLERKEVKGVLLFYCERYHCWISNKGCLFAQKKEIEINKNPAYFYVTPFCYDCKTAYIVQKIFNTKLNLPKPKETFNPYKEIRCPQCGQNKNIIRDFPTDQNGKRTSRICKVCSYKNRSKPSKLRYTYKIVVRENKIKEYFNSNPDSTQKECADVLGIHQNQVYQYFRKIRDKEKEEIKT